MALFSNTTSNIDEEKQPFNDENENTNVKENKHSLTDTEQNNTVDGKNNSFNDINENTNVNAKSNSTNDRNENKNINAENNSLNDPNEDTNLNAKNNSINDTNENTTVNAKNSSLNDRNVNAKNNSTNDTNKNTNIDAKNNSLNKTKFAALPNELIIQLFGFLNNNDILHAFTQINHRYAKLVRSHVKQIDLTDEWQIDQQELKWICRTIQALKIDRHYVHLLADQGDREKVKSSTIRENRFQQNETSTWRTFMNKVVTLFRTWLPWVTSANDYEFLQLHSLELVNVSRWNKVISDMNLNNLSLWFDNNMDYMPEQSLIPQTITRFSANGILFANCFHANLIDLNVYINSVVHLLTIVEHTPNVQCLSATFANYFDNPYEARNYECDRFESMTVNFRCLNNLSRLSFSTRQRKDGITNKVFPFNQIQVFIDRCCPNKATLKKVALKLDYITLGRGMWTTILRYKSTFDRFNFYASFIPEQRISEIIDTLPIADQFDFHLENSDPIYLPFVHIYSLPFGFNELHGFISCSELSPRCSYSAVQHLYFTTKSVARPISFESLVRRMPSLVSINCDFKFNNDYNINNDYHINGPEVIIDEEIFRHVRILCYKTCCSIEECRCHRLVPRLIDRMPNLQCLTTSENGFIHARHPLPPIKRLVLDQCEFECHRNLAQHVPYLTTLAFGNMLYNIDDLSQLIGSLFSGIPSLKLVSFVAIHYFNSSDRTLVLQTAEKAFARVQNMDNRLRDLRFEFDGEIANFSLRNL